MLRVPWINSISHFPWLLLLSCTAYLELAIAKTLTLVRLILVVIVGNCSLRYVSSVLLPFRWRSSSSSSWSSLRRLYCRCAIDSISCGCLRSRILVVYVSFVFSCKNICKQNVVTCILCRIGTDRWESWRGILLTPHIVAVMLCISRVPVLFFSTHFRRMCTMYIPYNQLSMYDLM